ncbi:oligopeptide ABC transporter permease [Entomoplasma ellychniae]|uniref:Oligopeptide ABC transporter permease n=1 Tax=Entomoplasma ellychniae TaxID=2114 RepID=A0A8E2QW31_9MOLU|nr:oligopeptide ABC transporter permease OppB [Entomoplasma ellychniae]PPE04751.1 oligopeptide ABC transporter permease [Entomoplasma ellychniae]
MEIIKEELENLIEKVSDNPLNKKSSHKILYQINHGFQESVLILDEFCKKHSLLTYSLKRIFFALITIYLAIIVVFWMISFVVKDEVLIADLSSKFAKMGIERGDTRYNKILENRKEALGVSGPLIYQILNYLKNVTPLFPKTVQTSPILNDITGNIETTPVVKWFYLGLALKPTNKPIFTPVSEIFSSGMKISFVVGFIGTSFGYILGIPLGVYAAIKKDKTADNVINWYSLIMFALPTLVTIKVFYEISMGLGSHTSWTTGGLYTRMFPILAIILLMVPGVAFMTRRYVVDEMNADYTRFATAKGMGEKYVFFVHVFRNSFIRMVRGMPGAFIFTIFGTSLLIERTWNIQGMTYFVIGAMGSKDLFTVMGFVVISSFLGIFANLIGDLLLAILDPRVKLS